MRDSRVIDIAFGGFYASTTVDTGEVTVFRLLDFNVEVVHLALYSQKFDAPPSGAEARALSPLIRHVPIDARTLLRDDGLHLIGHHPLSADDLNGYLAYLEHMGVSEHDRGIRVSHLIAFSQEPPMRLRLSAGQDALLLEEAS